MKGLAHIGVLQALAERGLVPTCVIGTSVGALVGAAWAAGHDPAELSEIAVNLRRKDVFVLAHSDMAFKRMRSPALFRREPLDTLLEQGIEGFPAEQGGGAHALERHVGVRQHEYVLAAQIDRDLAQLGGIVTGGPGRAHESADTGADDARRDEAALSECLKHADMRKAFHAAAAKNETKARFFVHDSVPLARRVNPRVT